MSKKALPISSQQFREALCSVWQPSRSPNQRHVLGLAVSGGVDSMALAHLCTRLQREQPGPGRLLFRAFIVDHQARLGSSVEARSVASNLRKIGLPTTIIHLRWHERGPAQLHDFETIARRLRYRALGRACRHFRIRSLLLAHHEDDQAETVLVRLLSGRTGVGLQGIKPETDIPECFGLYGISASGGWPLASDSPNSAHAARDNADRRPSIGSADGGIMLHRPLLQFSKDRLHATCEESTTPWFDDPTNKDVGVTSRNAVRHLLLSERLPRPLRKSALLNLCKFWQTVAEHRSIVVMAALKELDIKALDLRSGRLVFRMSLPTAAEHRANSAGSKDKGKMGWGREFTLPHAAKMIERISSLVSPCESVRKDQMATVLNRVFPQVLPKDSVESKISHAPQVMTAANIRWHGILHDSNSDNPRMEWTLTRQPLKANGVKPTCTWIKASSQAKDKESQTSFWAWQLFDGRFWIRTHHSRSQMVIARFLEKDDMSALRAQLDTSRQLHLDRLLSESAPGDTRFTLPALTVEVDGPVVALPTLGFQVDMASDSLKWQVQYKKVVLPGALTPSSSKLELFERIG